MALLDDIFASGPPTLGGDAFTRDQWLRLLTMLQPAAQQVPEVPRLGADAPVLPPNIAALLRPPSAQTEPLTDAPVGSAAADSLTGARRVPTAEELLARIRPAPARSSTDSLTGGSIPERQPATQMRVPSRLPSAEELARNLAAVGQEGVGPFRTQTVAEAPMPPVVGRPEAGPEAGPDADAVVRGAEAAAAARRPTTASPPARRSESGPKPGA